MKDKKKIEKAIELLKEIYDENRGGYNETGNYDDSFYQGMTCGAISAVLTILKEEVGYV